MIGLSEIVLVCGILLLVFGARHIPKIASTIARTARSFKSGLTSDDDDEKDVTPRKPNGKK